MEHGGRDARVKFARIILGILLSVLNWMYALAIFYGEVAGSFRWEQVIREHLSGPAVAEKALSSVVFAASLTLIFGCERNTMFVGI